MKFGIYARYSSNNQRASSVEDQIRKCKEFCIDNGDPNPLIFSDEAISGSRHDRNDYKRMEAASKNGDLDVLVVEDFSRLGRDFVDSERCARQLEFLGIRIVSLSDSYDSNVGTRGSRQLNRGLKNLINENYTYDLADKTYRGKRPVNSSFSVNRFR